MVNIKKHLQYSWLIKLGLWEIATIWNSETEITMKHVQYGDVSHVRITGPSSEHEISQFHIYSGGFYDTY